MKVGGVAEANALKPAIERIAKACCDWRDSEATKQNLDDSVGLDHVAATRHKTYCTRQSR